MWPRVWMTSSAAAGGFTSPWGRNYDRSESDISAAGAWRSASQTAPTQTLVVLATGDCVAGVAVALGAGGYCFAGASDRYRYCLDYRPDSRAANRGGPGFPAGPVAGGTAGMARLRSEEHTSELQSRPHLVCRL